MNKQSKIALRQNLQDLRGFAKYKNTLKNFEKQNLYENYKNKQVIDNKNITLNLLNAGKTMGTTVKKLSQTKNSNYQFNDYYEDKLKTQIDVYPHKRKISISGKKQIGKNLDYHYDDSQKKHFKKDQYSNTKKTNNNYFLTADVSNVLRAINLQQNNTIHAKKSKEKRINMMTEQDIQKLFIKQLESSKKNSKQNSKNKYDTLIMSKNNSNHEQLKTVNSKNYDKTKDFLNTDPDLFLINQKGPETFNPNIDQMINQIKIDNSNKDFAESIKFLQISESPTDKLLSALKNQGLIVIQQDSNIDKTLKFKSEFMVGKQIGEGAYASVRIAIHRPSNQKVAIKIYEKTKINEIPKKKSVKRQIKILQKINHKNILKIYDVIETNNHVNIIMQYIPGINLHQYLKNQPYEKATQSNAKRIFIPLVESIKYIHGLSICHRDIKLQNIILDNKLNPKLIDFGFSTCIQQDRKIKIFCGTPSYMSPQIVLKTQYKGQPADIWALGVLLYVMLTGIFPFKGNTDKQLYKKIVNSEYAKLQGTSKQSQYLISRMLTIDPQIRITASQILQHEWITGVPKKTKTSIEKRKNEFDEMFNQKLMETLVRKSNSKSKEKITISQIIKKKKVKEDLKFVYDMQSPKQYKHSKTSTNRESLINKYKNDIIQRSNSRLISLVKIELKNLQNSSKSHEKRKNQQSQERLSNKLYI